MVIIYALAALLAVSCAKNKNERVETSDTYGNSHGTTFIGGDRCREAGHWENRHFCEYFITHHNRITTQARKYYYSFDFSGGFCATTQAMALQEAGLVTFTGREIPLSTLKLRGALVTGGFVGGVNWGAPKGWQDISCQNLKPGDIVLTTPSVGKDYPAHSFMFLGWVKKANIPSLYAANKITKQMYDFHKDNAASFNGGRSNYIAWGLDYRNSKETELSEKAYIRWMTKIPNKDTINISETTRLFPGNEKSIQGHNLCLQGMRSAR